MNTRLTVSLLVVLAVASLGIVLWMTRAVPP